MLLATQGRGLIVVNTTTMAAQTIRMEEGLPTNNINQAISDQLSGVHVDWEHCAVGDLTGMVRYLVHYEDADKHQYEIADMLGITQVGVKHHLDGALKKAKKILV